MKPMVDMEMTDEEAGEAMLPMPMSRQTYPYGLRICLCDADMAKLNMDPAEATKDSYIHFGAMARVTSVTTSDGGNRIELQIEKMTPLESEGDETEETGRGMRKKSPLYDRS